MRNIDLITAIMTHVNGMAAQETENDGDAAYVQACNEICRMLNTLGAMCADDKAEEVTPLA